MLIQLFGYKVGASQWSALFFLTNISCSGGTIHWERPLSPFTHPVRGGWFNRDGHSKNLLKLHSSFSLHCIRPQDSVFMTLLFLLPSFISHSLTSFTPLPLWLLPCSSLSLSLSLSLLVLARPLCSSSCHSQEGGASSWLKPNGVTCFPEGH